TDRDCMAWEATAGTNVRMTLRSHTDGFDPEIQVVDPTGVTVTTKSCSGDRSGLPPIQCTVQTDLAPTLSGTYTLCIRDTGADDAADHHYRHGAAAGVSAAGLRLDGLRLGTGPRRHGVRRRRRMRP